MRWRRRSAPRTADSARPTLICCRTVIGWGAPTRAGSHKAHGEPLGVEEVAGARARLGWTLPPFEVPAELRAAWDRSAAGRAAEARWQALFARYRAAHPELAAGFERRMNGELPATWAEVRAAALAAAAGASGSVATRASSQAALNAIGPALPGFIGGSADLTRLEQHLAQGFARGHRRRRVRQLHPLRRARIRHDRDHERPGAAWRADSLRRHLPGVLRLRAQRGAHGGADAPARDPRVHARFDRPGRRRPDAPADRARRQPAADAEPECLAPGRRARDRGGLDAPRSSATMARRCLVLTRQGLPQLARGGARALRRRARRLRAARCGGRCARMHRHRHRFRGGTGAARRCSNCRRRAGACAWCPCPSTDIFDAQDAAWREAVLPAAVTRRLAIEAGATGCGGSTWAPGGRVLGIDQFGASGKAPDLFRQFGLTPDNVLSGWY